MPDHPMRREGDNGKVSATKTFLKDWSGAFVLLTGALLALGFKYTTPKQEMDGIKTEITELKEVTTELKQVTRDQAQDISTIVRLQCFNIAFTTQQLNLVGVKCAGIR